MTKSIRRQKRLSDLIKDNAGLSFVELLVAMILLLIILGPVMKSIIAGLEVNRNARKVMCATDAAQCVMEGISGKSFEGILGSYNPSLSQLTKYNELSRVAGSNVYNENIIKTHGVVTTTDPQFKLVEVVDHDLSDGDSTDYSQFILNGIIYNTKELALLSTSTDTNKSNTIIQEFGQYGLCLLTDPYDTSSQVLVMHGDNAAASDDSKARVIFFAYYNIEWNGYTFDAVGYIIPATEAAHPNFYPCAIRIGMYEVKDGVHTILTQKEPVLAMTDGIRNK